MSINQRRRGDQGKKEWDGESPSIPPALSFFCLLFMRFLSCSQTKPSSSVSLHDSSRSTTRLFSMSSSPFSPLYILLSFDRTVLFVLCVFSPPEQNGVVFLPPPSILPVLIKTVPAASQRFLSSSALLFIRPPTTTIP